MLSDGKAEYIGGTRKAETVDGDIVRRLGLLKELEILEHIGLEDGT